METINHNPSSLYTFIENARQRENLAIQIARMEEDLHYFDQAITLYEKLGFDELAEKSAEKHNQTYASLLRLKLKMVDLDKRLLKFELSFLTENKVKNFSENNKNIKNFIV